MALDIVRLEREHLRKEYGCETQRLQPWAVLNAPFEGSFAVVRAGTTSALHSHHEHEIFIALRGTAAIECDGEVARLDAGDVVLFRPGRRHCVHNVGDEDFEFYSVWWDAAMADRFIARDSAGGSAGRNESAGAPA